MPRHAAGRMSIAQVVLFVAVAVTCLPPAAFSLVPAFVRPASLVPDVQAAYAAATTAVLACLAAAVAAALAVGPAWLIARGGVTAALALASALAALCVPEAAWAYAAAEAWRYAFVMPAPRTAGFWAWTTLAVALSAWPVAALTLGAAWARLPGDVLDAARLDGGERRVSRALLVGPLLAGGAGALVVAARQGVAYDGGGVATAAFVARERFALTPGDTARRTAAAAAVLVPVVLALAALAVWAWGVFVRTPAGDDAGTSAPPRPGVAAWGSLAAIVLLVGAGVAALVVTGGGAGSLVEGLAESWPQWRNGAGVALACGAWVATLALLATWARPTRLAWAMALAATLLGGQLAALGLIRLLAARPDVASLAPLAALQDVAYAVLYDRWPWFAWAPASLFAFVGLAAGSATWRGGIGSLRDVARVDGAGPLAEAWHVALPLAWPLVAAAGLAGAALAWGESHAAVLMFPGNLVNTMSGNVHTLAYGPMARAALVSAATGAGVACLAVAVAWVFRTRRNARHAAVAGLCGVTLVVGGCDAPPDTPAAVVSEAGAGRGQVVYPRAVAYSEADDAWWVIDRTARVQRLSAETGAFEHGWQMPDHAYGKPVGIGVDARGNVWVPDTHYFRVIVYTPGGTELFRLGGEMADSDALGRFVWPTDVLVLDERRVLVGEYGQGPHGDNDRIQLFERDDAGAWRATRQVGRFGTGPGEFRRPQSLARVGDVLYVVDAGNHRIAVFSIADADFGAFTGFLADGGASAEAGRLRFPYGLDVDAAGDLIVAEFGNNRVQRLDPATGKSLGTWGRFGARPGELRYPWAVAYDTRRGRAAVVDSGNDRLQIIDLGGPTGGGGPGRG